MVKKHDIEVSRETVRQWMVRAKLWRARQARVEKIHQWRPRRSRFGELAPWETSDHGWLKGVGDEIPLIKRAGPHYRRFLCRQSNTAHRRMEMPDV